MGKSEIGGIFGYQSGKVGPVVYSTLATSLNGGRRQIVRLKPTSVRNPKTLAQIVQRMKMGPAQLFYAAFEKAAGSVENNPLSHSFQGYPYGSKNRSRFMQLALVGDPKAYVPKGVNFPIPGVYQVSEGSLPSLPSGISDDGDTILAVGTDITSAQVSALATLGVEVGDQVTCVALVEKEGVYNAAIARVIIAEGNEWEIMNNEGDIEDLYLKTDGINFNDTENGNVACAAFIISRGVSSSNAKRSTAVMTIAPDYESLMSPEAYDAAVESWMTGVSYNSLNSDWYLNQGTSQAFNGEVFSQILTLAAGDGVAEESARFILGRQSNGGSILYTIFTSDGTSSGTAYAVKPNGAATDVAWTATRVATALGNVNIQYAQYSDAIYAQLEGNA